MDKIKYCSNQDLCYLIWQNLISNAVKYTKEGGDINLKLHTEDSWVVFTITNSGNSLQGKEDLIFQPFYTSDAFGQEKGTG